MAKCYVCDHPISIKCSRCGEEIRAEDYSGQGEYGDAGTDISIEPHMCEIANPLIEPNA